MTTIIDSSNVKKYCELLQSTVNRFLNTNKYTVCYWDEFCSFFMLKNETDECGFFLKDSSGQLIFLAKTYEEVRGNFDDIWENIKKQQQSKIAPSVNQIAIIDAITTKGGNIAINAVAGSGKSSTLKMVAQSLQEKGVSPSDVKVIVFGKANAEELAEKFGEGWKQSVSTLHSAGFSVLKQKLARNQKVKVDGLKYKKIAEQQGLLDTRNRRGQIEKTGELIARGICEHEQPFLKLIDLLRLNNLEPTPDNVFNVIKHFDIEGLEVSQRLNADWLCDQITDVLGQGIDDALPSDSSATAVVDFTDMIWVPVVTVIKPRYRAQYVLIDECQDLNAAQAELALSLVAPGGRVLAVGDPYQAIMGFSGADDSAYQKLVNRLGAREMPLSICYRCPKSHIRLVNRIFPAIPIQAAEAVEGTVANISALEWVS